MNKHILGGLLFLYIALMTLIADSLLLTVDTGVIDGVNVGALEASTATSLIGSFWAMLTFSLPIPFVLTIILVHAPLLVLILILLDYIVELIPFT